MHCVLPTCECFPVWVKCCMKKILTCFQNLYLYFSFERQCIQIGASNVNLNVILKILRHGIPHFQYSSPNDRRMVAVVVVFQLCQQLAVQGLRNAESTRCRKLLQLQNVDTQSTCQSDCSRVFVNDLPSICYVLAVP